MRYGPRNGGSQPPGREWTRGRQRTVPARVNGTPCTATVAIDPMRSMVPQRRVSRLGTDAAADAHERSIFGAAAAFQHKAQREVVVLAGSRLAVPSPSRRRARTTLRTTKIDASVSKEYAGMPTATWRRPSTNGERSGAWAC